MTGNSEGRRLGRYREQQVPGFHLLAGDDVDLADAAGDWSMHIRLHLHSFERKKLGIAGFGLFFTKDSIVTRRD